MALVVLGARASPHSAILGTDVSNCPLKRRNRPDFRKLGSSREPFCQQLSKHLMNSASSSSAFSLSRSGLFGIIALTEAVMSLCPWIQNESEAQIVRGYLSTAIENFKELWKRGDAEGLVHSLGARIWCIDIDLALQVNKQPFLGHEDILSIFSLSDCPPEYLLSCQALLQSDPEQHFRDGLPSPFGPKCRNKVLPLSLYALRRTTLLATLSVPSLTFSSLLQLVQALFVLQAQHAKWFLAHREYIFRKTTLPLSPRSAASHTRMFILQELENIALVFAAQWICDEAKKLWGCVDEYRDDLNAIGRVAEKMTQESVDRGLMLLRRGLTVFSPLCCD
ncbi:hypothetical protein BT69DRAFT_529468 [Atractiella rhizophila]|nr:hypothetical protein BT69DRAFT_529468 [Atractiella rhizophila]